MDRKLVPCPGRALIVEKPQGFEVGRQARAGNYHCYYNCGKCFRSKNAAKHHDGCKGEEECDKNIDVLYKISRRIRGQYENNGADQRTVVNNYEREAQQIFEEADTKYKGTNDFDEFLKKLPTVEDRIVEVERYLCSLPI
ncbi:unnamed protein product [Orchesella dallaii]|uniref:C2H2-type domain-containing protein n=1 Tax=Orchesella dallaii TaxID=48710 RepID=A0ABP1PW91_9HEXA